VIHAEVDLRVGGRFRLGIQFGEDTSHFVSGIFKTVQSPQKLVFTWRWEGPEMDVGESQVTIELEPAGGKTKLRLTHALLPQAALQPHQEGWIGILDELESYLGAG
jgi:uncharacterized protein YndB with AHSA1/START domain